MYECVKILHHIVNILEEMYLKEYFISAPIDIYNDNQSSINWNHSMTTKGIRHLQMRKNAVREAVQTNFASVKHVSGKVNLSDIIAKEDKDKAHYITLQDRLISKLAIMGKVRRFIQICSNISVIPTYEDICHKNPPPKHISDVDSTCNDSYKMISIVESKGGVVNPPDVFPSPGTSVRRPSLGLY